jgi:hypothetical protein
VSGHTHTCKPIVESYSVGKTLSSKKGNFDGINVGSTTDFDPHAVIVGPYKEGKNNQINNTSLGYTKISYKQPQESASCNKVMELAKIDEGTLKEICNTHSYSTTLGLDKSYQKECWTNEATAIARKNIDLFAASSSTKLGFSQDEVKACLAYVATKNEH